MFWIALVAMMSATLANHLGLTQAIVRILLKIAKCAKCSSFWFVMAVLVWHKCDMVIATLLSLAMAYLSHWMGVALYLLNQLYNAVWEAIQRRR